MIRDLIRERFGVRLSAVSVGRLLKRLGLAPPKPLHRAYEQNPQRVRAWLINAFPKIRILAKEARATVYFSDEAGVHAEFSSDTARSPRDKTSIAGATARRHHLSLISAISLRGDMRFIVVEGPMNAGRFIEFLQRLLHDATRPVFLILYGHPAHRTREIFDFTRSADGRLRLFFLLPYPPEPNPDETAWSRLEDRGPRPAHRARR